MLLLVRLRLLGLLLLAAAALVVSAAAVDRAKRDALNSTTLMRSAERASLLQF
jgi:hypothetical protein